MADEEHKDVESNTAAPTAENGAGTTDEANAPQAGMIAQYIKDLSFENPNAPKSLQLASQGRPAINLNVNVAVEQTAEDNYEVLLHLEAQAKYEDTVAFVVDLSYAGLFGIRNVPREAMQPFLLVEAPHLLFPFARRVLADAVRDGGFAPLMLDPIDFSALYRQQLEKQQAAGGGEPNGNGVIQGGMA
ncbi:MAG: protein-export chaperone SecB [Sphingomonadales bacterium]|jgi:preprotein translocase subunit SecB